MTKPPSNHRNRLLVTLILTLFIFSAFLISGFNVTHTNSSANLVLPPADGGGTGGQQGTAPRAGAQQAGTNVIRNGDFEQPWVDNNGIAPQWDGYRNGQAWEAWYQETWKEAVRSGKQAQLMEIFQVEPNVLDRVIAIFQTVNVVPNSRYDLTFWAILRSQVQAQDRNKFEAEINWGVDYTGQGRYENVQQWAFVPLTEQFRLGSGGKYPEDIPLHYEVVTGTINTGNSSQITLFIRGWKKFPTGPEYNFDIDDVSLVGPVTGVQPTPSVPVPPTITPPAAGPLPTSGSTLVSPTSTGMLVIAGLVLIVLGASATAGLLRQRKE